MNEMKCRTGLVLKVLSRQAWADAQRSGAFAGSADDQRDGYIHLSTLDQIGGTLARHYRGQSGLVLVAFAASDLGSGLRWEPSRGGDLFPHLYAPLPAAAALWTRELALGPDGLPQLPAELPPC